MPRLQPRFTLDRIGPEPHIAVEHVGSGPLLVFLHGIGGNRTNWWNQLAAFGAHVHAVTWDARGYGDSDDYEGALDFHTYAEDVLRVLDHFGAETAHLCGLSMGGRIAMDVALTWPDRVASLTLCDTHLGFARMPEERKAAFIASRRDPLVAGKEPKDIAGPVARTLVSPQAVPGAYERLVESMTNLHKDSYIKSIEASVQTDTVTGLERIAVPTHVIVGADDRLTPPAMAEQIAGQIPGATLTVIPEAGHLSNIEQPGAFNAAALAFLIRQVAPSAS